MKARISVTIVGFLLLTFLLISSTAAIAGDFYQGKTIRFIVGFAAGGGYDAYTRTIARYISRHIPGNPSTWSRTWMARVVSSPLITSTTRPKRTV